MTNSRSTPTRDPVVAKIIAGVGGPENVSGLTHCVTRLRFELRDASKADLGALGRIEGVMRAQNAAGQTQVVVGSKVERLFEEITAELGSAGTPKKPQDSGSSNTPVKRENVFNRVIAVIASIFTPAIPALMASGMIKALTAVLTMTGVLQPETTIFVIATVVGDCVFFFLPIILAVSAAKKFNTNPFLAMFLGAVMVHPTWAAYVATLTETGATTTTLFGLPVLLVTYSSSVIPIILAVWILKHLLDFLNRVIPEMLRVVVVPLLIALLMIPAILIVVGPLGHYVGTGIGFGVSWLFDTAGWLAGAVLSGGRSILVIFGLHYSFFPIQLQEIAANGSSALLVGAFVANLGQFGAVLGLSVVTRGSERAGAAATAFPALFAITEPAIYGYNLRYKFPFFASCVAAAIVGGILGFGNTVVTAFLPPSFVSFGALDGDFPFVVIIGLMLSTPVLSFVFTVLYAKTIGRASLKRTLEQAEANGSLTADEVALPAATTDDTSSAPSDTSIHFVSPMTGQVVPLNEVPDALFADEVVGRGVAIRPTEGTVLSPADAEVIMVAGTGHAVGLKLDNGAEILIHVGIDTVKLDGAPFRLFVKEGDSVLAGQLLLVADLDAIAAAGLDTVTPIVVSPADVAIDVLASGHVAHGTALYNLERTPNASVPA